MSERRLRQVAEEISGSFFRSYPEHPCQKGNGECCEDTEFYISKEEADRITDALAKLPDDKRQEIVDRALKVSQGESTFCPLLENGECVLYSERPIICIWSGSSIRPVSKDSSISSMCATCHKTLIERGVDIPQRNINGELEYYKWLVPNRLYSTVTDAILIAFVGGEPMDKRTIFLELLSKGMSGK